MPNRNYCCMLRPRLGCGGIPDSSSLSQSSSKSQTISYVTPGQIEMCIRAAGGDRHASIELPMSLEASAEPNNSTLVHPTNFFRLSREFQGFALRA